MNPITWLAVCPKDLGVQFDLWSCSRYEQALLSLIFIGSYDGQVGQIVRHDRPNK